MHVEIDEKDAVVLGTALIVVHELIGPFMGPNPPTAEQQGAIKETLAIIDRIGRLMASEEATPSSILATPEYLPLLALSNHLIGQADAAHKTYHQMVQTFIVPNN